jgi:hypothetical protein
MLSRSQLVKDFDLRNVHLYFGPRIGFHLSAEVRTVYHDDRLYAAKAVEDPNAHQSVLLTWNSETVSEPPSDFKLWLYPDFAISSEYREILNPQELEVRVQQAKGNGDEYVWNSPKGGPICVPELHVFHAVKRDLTSRITMLYEQELLTVHNFGAYPNPNA